MLTKEQVETFLEKRLGLLDWQEQLNSSKEDFLTTLCRQYRRRTYFQNIYQVATPPAERRGPTVEDIVKQGMNSPGGVCIQCNYFLKMILDHLGYKVTLVGAEHISISLPFNHIFLLVDFSHDEAKDSEGGNRYLVDVGLAWPISEPINLKRLPYEYKAGGFKIRYQLSEDGVYQRVLIGGDSISKEFEDENEERVDLNFYLTPRAFEDFQETMQKLFTDTNSQTNFMLSTTMIFRYTFLEDDYNYEYVVCLGRTILQVTPTERKIQKYATYPEMVPDLMKHFPELDVKEVEMACEHYQRVHDEMK